MKCSEEKCDNDTNDTYTITQTTYSGDIKHDQGIPICDECIRKICQGRD